MKTPGLFFGGSSFFTLIVLLAARAAFAGIGNDTWTGGSSGSANWSDAANWLPGSTNAPPLVNDELFFDGSTRTSPNNDFTAGTAFDGITFNSTASAFTLGGNGVLLSGNIAGITNGVVNNSSGAQTVNLNLNLDWGYHTFNSAAGSLALNGALTPNAGSAAYLGANLSSSSLTADTAGLISGLDGAGMRINGSGNYYGLATISGGSIGDYSYSAGNIYSAAATISSGINNNVELNPTANTTYTIASGTALNTVLNTSGASTATLAISGTLTMGPIGGFYVADGVTSSGGAPNATKNLITLNGTGSFVTAGGATPGTPGTLVFAVNGTGTGNSMAVNPTSITNNGSGAVTVVKVGTGSMYFQSVNGYSGGTYIDQGYLQANQGTAANGFSSFGSGPVYIASGATAFPNSTTTWSNNFYLSPGLGYPGAGTGLGDMRPGATTFAGTFTLLGSAGTVPGSICRINTQAAGVGISGQITGSGGLEDYSGGNANGSIILKNSSANPNNWTGGLIIDGTGNNNSLLTLGANNQIASNNVILIQSGTGVAELNLAGFNDVIGGLTTTNADALDIVANSAAATLSTLTLGANNATASFSGVIGYTGGSNNIAIVKTGTGTQTLSGANIYTGNTTVNGGTLALGAGGSIVNSTNIFINTGGALDISAVTSIATPANGSLTMSNGMLNVTVPSSGSSVTATTLNALGTSNVINIVKLPGAGAYPVQFPVIKYSGTLNGAYNFSLGSLPSSTEPYGGYLVNNTGNDSIDVVITNGPLGIAWTGFANGSQNSSWDFSTTDWSQGGSPVAYTDGSFITFNDSAHTGTVTLQQNVNPAGITVSNTALNYIIGGSYAINGSSGLLKQGTGTLTLDNSGGLNISGGVSINSGTIQVGNNDANGTLGAQTGQVVDNGAIVFNRNDSTLIVSNVISGSGTITNNGSGTVTLAGANTVTNSIAVNAGILKLGNNSALGNGNTTVVANNATLDLNGFSALHNNSVTAQGVGSSGQGAIDNSSAVNVEPGLTNLTMTGNTTIGTSGARWDLRSPSGNPAGSSLSTGGNAYNLTKVGAQFFGLVGTAVDPMLANVDVQNGTFDFEANTTGLGNPASTLSVEAAGIFEMWNATNQLNKNISLNSGSTLLSASGNNTIVGPMTFNGTDNVAVTNSTLTLSNAISGTGVLVKSGTSALTVAGTDAHSGGTTINDGSLILNTISSDPNNVVTENTTQTGSAVPVILGGNGTNIGPVDIEDTLRPSVNGHPSTFGVGSGPGNDYPGYDGTLMLGAQGAGAPTLVFDLNTNTTVGGGVNDLITVNGDFDPNFGHIKINPVNGALNTSAPYTLVTYNGTKNNNFNSSISLLSGISRYQFALNYPAGAVTLTVSGGPALLKWNNNANTGQWDVQSSQNWYNTGTSANDVFYNQDSVVLDDSILSAPNPLTTLTISSGIAVSPAVLTNNSSSANYTISGAGKITGAASIVKLGSSTLMLATTNDFTGPIMIAGGTLQINAQNALGATNGTVTITNGGTLDIGGPAFGQSAVVTGLKQFYVSGWGVNSNGVIINSGTVGQYAANDMLLITMQGDTAIGGPGQSAPGNGGLPGRWDMRFGTINPVLSTGGNAYNLYKVGGNQVVLYNTVVDTNLANVDIRGGFLELQGSTALGNPNATLTIETNGTFGFYAGTTPLSKNIVINGGYTNYSIYSEGGANTILGPITLNGNCIIGGSAALTNSGVISGNGGIIKSGGSTVILTSAETYTGNTTVSAGTLSLIGTASIANSTNLTVQAGATLDVSTRANSTLTLNSQTLAGNGTVSGNLSNAVGSVVSPGTNGVIGKLTVTGNAYLNGTTAMKLDKGNLTNDVLTVNGSLTYAGTLSLTNLSGTLANGDSFKLFNAGTYNGNFASIVPAHPNNDSTLNWNTSSLNVNGTLKVASAVTPVPHITGISLNGATLTITATNGSNGGQFILLQSTNIALPIAQWTPVLTNNFDGSGNLNLSTNVVNAAKPQTFYILQTQ